MSARAGRWARGGLILTLVLSVTMLAGRPLWAEAAALSLLAILLPLLALRAAEGSASAGTPFILAGILFAGAALLQMIPLPPALSAVVSPTSRRMIERAWPPPDGVGADFQPLRQELEALLEAPAEPPRPDAPPLALPSGEGEEPPLISIDQVLREAGLRGRAEATATATAEGRLVPPDAVPAARLRVPALRGVHLAPWRGRGALVKLLILVAAFALAASVLRAPARAYPFAGWLVAVGALTALVAILQIHSGAPHPLALLQPSEPDAMQTYGPFPNKNHLAGFLALLLPVACTLALSKIQAPPARILWGACACLMGLGILSVPSRGGLIAAAVGLAALALGLLARPGRRAQGAVLLVGAAGTAGALLLWNPGGVSRTVEGLVHTRPVEELRWILWNDALGMLRDFPLTGVGLDAFRPVFPHYKTFTDPLRFSHLESDWFQFLVEMGLLGLPALLLAVAAAVSGFSRALRQRSAPVLAIGAWAGVTALAAHALMDFQLHVTANALAFALVLALAVGTTPRPRRDAPRGRSRARTTSLLVASALAAVGALSFLVPRGLADWQLQEARRNRETGRIAPALEAAARSQRWDPSRPDLRKLQTTLRLQAGILDPRPASGWNRAAFESAALGLLEEPTRAELHRDLGGMFLARGGYSTAEDWLGRAVWFDPTDSLAREQHGDALRFLGRGEEAIAEYASAMDTMPGERSHAIFVRLLGKALAAGHGAEELKPLVAIHPVRAVYLVEALAARGSPEEARALADEVLERWPDNLEAARGVYRFASRNGEYALASRAVERWEALSPQSGVPLRVRALLSQRAGDVEAAELEASRAVELEPSDPANYHVLASILAAQGRYREAIEVVRRGLQVVPGHSALLQLQEDLVRRRYREHRRKVDRILRGEE